MDNFLSIIGYILIFWSGYELGALYTIKYYKKLAREVLEREGLSNETTKTDVHKLIIQNIQNTLYMFNHKDEFICQAETVEDLAKLALEYKNIKYAAVLYNEKTYMFVDGEVKTKV